MHVQQLMLRDAMKMPVCEDAWAQRKARRHQPRSKLSKLVAVALRKITDRKR